MSFKSDIEWTESTWNPVTGCSKISSGCKNCYAERLARRLQAMGNPSYVDGFKVRIHEHLFGLPLKWSKPRIVFVNSMSDLFHEDVTLDHIRAIFQVISLSKQHIFQVLTKRSKRLLELAPKLHWPNNLWMGVTVESSEYLNRIPDLRLVPAALRFISFEPLLSSIQNVDLSGISWAIVGGESGPGARPMMTDWAQGLRDQCLSAGVPFFFKQWGGFRKNSKAPRLDGRIWNQMPQKKANSLAMQDCVHAD